MRSASLVRRIPISNLPLSSLLFPYSRKDGHLQPPLHYHPSTTHNPRSENKEKKVLFQKLMQPFHRGGNPQNKNKEYLYPGLPFPLPLRHSYLRYKIFSAHEGELSQNAFCSQHDKQKKPTRILITTWHTVHFQTDKSFCPTRPFCYLNDISVLCIRTLFEIFIFLVTFEIDSSLWTKE